MRYETPLSNNGYMKSLDWKFMKTSSLCPFWKKLTFLQYYINSEPYQSHWNNYLVLATIKEQHYSVTCSV